MTHKNSKSHPVAVRVIYNAKKSLAPTTKVPVVSEKKREVLAKEVMGQKETQKDFVKPKLARKKFSFKPTISFFAQLFVKYRTTSVIVAALGVSAVFFVVYLFPRIFYKSTIPNFLPENTVFFSSISLDPLNVEFDKFISDLNASGKDFDTSFLESVSPIKAFMPLSEARIAETVDREAAFALYSGDDGIARTLILHVSDSSKAQKLLENLSRDKNLEQKEYKGENIFTVRDKNDATKSFSYMYVQKYVFLSSSVTSPFTLIDVMHKDEASLSQKTDYKKLSSQSRMMSLGLMYIDTPKISGLAGVAPLLESLTPYITLVQDQSMYVSLYEKAGTLAFDAVFPRTDMNTEEIRDPKLLPHLTKTTLVAIEGKNFSQDWNDLETNLKNSQPLLAFYFTNIKKRLSDSFEFNLDKDFVSFFQNPYVIAVDGSTSRSKNTGKPFQNMAMVLELTNPSAFNEAQPKLEEKVKKILSSQFQNQPVSLTQEGYAGLTLNVLSGDGMPVNVYYVVKDGKLMVSTNKSFFDNVVLANGQGSLAEFASYQRLTSISRANAKHIIFINKDESSRDLFPEKLRGFMDAVLVRDTQKGDNAVITGYIHLVAKQ